MIEDLEATNNMNTLIDYRYRHHFKAGAGGAGMRQKMHGAKGEAVVLLVPCGTIVRDADTNELIADLVEDGQRLVLVGAAAERDAGERPGVVGRRR